MNDITRNDIYIFTGVFNWNMLLVDFVYACALGIQKHETYTKIQSPKINANEGSCKMSNMKEKKKKSILIFNIAECCIEVLYV